MDSTLARKLERDRPLRLLDLFSGCGGMTLGFHRAGMEPVAAVELDPHAARSHALNFHGGLRESNPGLFQRHSNSRDITTTTPEELVEDLHLGPVDDAVDVIVGGPPCPAFTRVGRAKLREVNRHPEAYRHDPRWQLYLQYLDYVRAMKPLAMVMENVPDVLNFGGRNVGEEIAESLQQLGYVPRYTLLNAAHYGVPQMRDRFFLVAFHEALQVEPRFPAPTHSVSLPAGYRSSRQVALQHVEGLFRPCNYVAPPAVDASLAPGITVREALDDLPHLPPRRRGARRLDETVSYGSAEPSAYAAAMRSWPGFSTDAEVTAHVTRSLSERDYRLFEQMRSGDDYPRAHRLAERLLQDAARKRDLSPAETEVLRPDFVPPYDATKFPNKWRKMEPDRPARTLMAHLGKDTYTHIHYSDAERRVISVREAARLQSFPDGFSFSGTMNPGFRQVGNAVPPLVANAIAEEVAGALRRASRGDGPLVATA